MSTPQHARVTASGINFAGNCQISTADDGRHSRHGSSQQRLCISRILNVASGDGLGGIIDLTHFLGQR
jgi:hypothetical protein